MISHLRMAGICAALMLAGFAWQAGASESATVSTDPRDILTVDERVGWDMNYSLEYTQSERSQFLADFFRGATVQSVKPFLDSKQLLQQAARYMDNADVIAFLIESGYDPNEAFGTGIPGYPQDGREESVYDGERLVWAGNGGIRREGPLHFAAKYNPNAPIIDTLLQGGADVHAPAGNWLNTPLQYAAGHNNAAVVSALLRAGARVDDVNGRIDPMFRRQPNINGNTALHSAGANEDASVVDVLVDAGADVNRMNASGLTPLHFAVINGRAATLTALVRRGADPNAWIGAAESEEQTHDCQDCGAFSLLMQSLVDRVDGVDRHALDDIDLEQTKDLIHALVDAGVDIDAAGWALDLAVRAELGSRLVALLIDAGVTVETYLLEAVFAPTFQYAGHYAGGSRFRDIGAEENLRVLDLLIGKGVDVNIADSCGITALHLTASSAHSEENTGLVKAVRKLVAAGADVNAKTVQADDHCEHFGATPLHVAASGGALDVASALIDAGADMEAKDAEGRIPLDLAAVGVHSDMVELLRHRSENRFEIAPVLHSADAESDAGQ